MGAWNYKALDNDTALDAMSWIENCNMEMLPFITSLLLQSQDDYKKLLGIMIVISCKVKPLGDLYTCSSDFPYKTLWEDIYNKAKTDKEFNDQMYFYSGYTYSAIKQLEWNIKSWDEDIRECRLAYLDRLKKIYNLKWNFVE